MTNQQKLKQLFKLLEEIDAYGRSLGKLQFDMECCAPEEGMAQAGEDMAILGKQFHKLTHSRKYQRLVLEVLKKSKYKVNLCLVWIKFIVCKKLPTGQKDRK